MNSFHSLHRATAARAIRLGLLLLVATASLRGAEATEMIAVQSAIIGVIDEVEVPASVAGVLATVSVSEGDVVETGTQVASIDDREARFVYQRAAVEHEIARHKSTNDVSVRSAERAIEYASDEYTRLKRARDQVAGSISRSELEESRLKADQATLDLEQARREQQFESLTEKLKMQDRELARHRVRLCEIHAPIKGTVVEVFHRHGEWVEPGESVLRIVRTDRLKVDGLIDVANAVEGLIGSPATISFERPGRTSMEAKGQVVFLHPEINPVSGQARVRVEFDNTSGDFLPGMRVNMDIAIGGTESDISTPKASPPTAASTP